MERAQRGGDSPDQDSDSPAPPKCTAACTTSAMARYMPIHHLRMQHTMNSFCP
ncbi:hypothetical protein PAXRUDRAFT_823832 [Paxillus rubicundulus Ve08.2h10]|uniref:Uncharacterized protein n=1 Tax=Paxillus rubicundulus Ve08.2h10 TaxID=930991 RepID=A0A0D0E8G2_9AGAM|nr:hypothetical protein PAXRUDRAFT_823832 [Paxillus rubicundulus Ve08.2h10]